MARRKLLDKFCSCIKKTRKTVKVKKSIGGTRESAAIGICVKSVLQTRNKTLRKFSCGLRLKGQRPKGVKGKKKFLQTQKIKK